MSSDESHKLLKESVHTLARLKALDLGIDPYTFNDFCDLVWRVQFAEGNSRCYLMKTECDQDKCCWRPLCMGDRWL